MSPVIVMEEGTISPKHIEQFYKDHPWATPQEPVTCPHCLELVMPGQHRCE